VVYYHNYYLLVILGSYILVRTHLHLQFRLQLKAAAVPGTCFHLLSPAGLTDPTFTVAKSIVSSLQKDKGINQLIYPLIVVFYLLNLFFAVLRLILYILDLIPSVFSKN